MGTCCWTLGSPQPCSGSKGAAGKVLRRGLGGRPGWGTWRMGMGRKDPGTEGPAGLCPGLEIQEGCPEPAGPPADRGGGRGWSGSGQGARAWEMRGRADRMGLWRKTIPVLIWKISQNLVQVQRPRQALGPPSPVCLPSLPPRPPDAPPSPTTLCPVRSGSCPRSRLWTEVCRISEFLHVSLQPRPSSHLGAPETRQTSGIPDNNTLFLCPPPWELQSHQLGQGTELSPPERPPPPHIPPTRPF